MFVPAARGLCCSAVGVTVCVACAVETDHVCRLLLTDSCSAYCICVRGLPGGMYGRISTSVTTKLLVSGSIARCLSQLILRPCIVQDPPCI
jgi:hypothetical protein